MVYAYNPSIIAFIREKENNKVFEVFNLTDEEKTFTLQGTLYVGNYRDAFTNDSVLFSENTQMTLPAWGYKVYEYGSGITGVDDEVMLTEEFNLFQNYPNPFNPTTTIQFSIPSVTLSGVEESFVTLKVFDLLGREVANLIDENMNEGIYEREFKADNLSSGTYFYSLSTEGFTQTKKLVLMK